jgi:hypothetical protein
MKEAASRTKDLRDLDQLNTLKKLIDSDDHRE